MLGFVIGLFVGASLGAIVMAFVAAGGRADESCPERFLGPPPSTGAGADDVSMTPPAPPAPPAPPRQKGEPDAFSLGPLSVGGYGLPARPDGGTTGR